MDNKCLVIYVWLEQHKRYKRLSYLNSMFNVKQPPIKIYTAMYYILSNKTKSNKIVIYFVPYQTIEVNMYSLSPMLAQQVSELCNQGFEVLFYYFS